jgi:hypothetical protein
MTDTLFWRPSLLFTPLVNTSLLLISSLPIYASLHFTTLSFGVTSFKFPTAPFHLTLLHFTSLHCLRCGHPGQVIIWRPVRIKICGPLKPIFFEFFWPGTGLAKILRACAQIVDKFQKNSFACGNLSLLAPHFWIFQRYLSSPCRLAPQAAAGWSTLVQPCSGQTQHCVVKWLQFMWYAHLCYIGCGFRNWKKCWTQSKRRIMFQRSCNHERVSWRFTGYSSKLW